MKLHLRRRNRQRDHADTGAARRRRYEQFKRSHEERKLHITEANKNGMGFNGL